MKLPQSKNKNKNFAYLHNGKRCIYCITSLSETCINLYSKPYSIRGNNILLSYQFQCNIIIIYTMCLRGWHKQIRLLHSRFFSIALRYWNVVWPQSCLITKSILITTVVERTIRIFFITPVFWTTILLLTFFKEFVVKVHIPNNSGYGCGINSKFDYRHSNCRLY